MKKGIFPEPKKGYISLINYKSTMKNLTIPADPRLTSTKAQALYRAGYAFIINNGGTPDEAHAHGLKQIAKIAKLRALAAQGQIIKH